MKAPRSMKPEGDYRQRMTRRLVALIDATYSRSYLPALPVLAHEHGVSTRTIRRDLEAIERVRPVRWRVNP